MYESKNQRRWDADFILAPSGDPNETIILTDQSNISGQLKSLAEQVARMELDKIAEIERDGYVRTDIVAISKKSKPQKDIASSENDHGSTEDDGSDKANNDRGVREGSDD